MTSSIDLDKLLTPISEELPAGDDLEYDPQFTSLLLEAHEGEEKTLGDASIAAEPVNWRSVSKNAIDLFSRTKDLRVALVLMRAQLQINGLQGLASTLLLIARLLEDYWSDVHPQLDAEDDDDPTLRINTLIALCDRSHTLNHLMLTTLVECKGIGKFSYRDIQASKGAYTKDDNTPEPTTILAAFMEVDAQVLLASQDILQQCIANISRIDQVLIKELGNANAPDLSSISKLVKDCLSVFESYLAERTEIPATVADEEGESGSAEAAGKVVRVANAEINSREDAAKMMDKISEYYQKHEPSSPIPLFMNRAKKLSTLSFMDIVADLTPDGLKQAKNVQGDAGK